MVKTVLKIKEIYSGKFNLQEILMLNIAAKNVTNMDDLPVHFTPSKKVGSL